MTQNFAITIVASNEIRPWGSITSVEEGIGYKVKRIDINPGHRLSLQMHHHRSEHVVIVSGACKCTIGDKETLLTKDQYIFIPQCETHRLENPGVIPLVIIQVETGEYLGDDDIIRFNDYYARK